MITDPTRALAWMVGLDDVTFLGLDPGEVTTVHVESERRPVGCPTCGSVAKLKDWVTVVLVDLPVYGRPTRLAWRKRRMECTDADCTTKSWTEEDDRIASARQLLTTRAARWATIQVGRHARSVSEVNGEPGCVWHSVNATVVACGEALLEADVQCFGAVAALGLDEVLMVRLGTYRTQKFSTQLVDVTRGQLLDVVPGRSGAGPMAWLAKQGPGFRDGIIYGTLDLSGPYRRVFELMTPKATLVAGPFHVLRHTNTKLDECRRRVQNETLGHRGRKSDPLYRGRRLLTKAKERLDDKGREKLAGLLRAGDPNGDVAIVWQIGSSPRALRPRRCRPRPRVGHPAGS